MYSSLLNGHTVELYCCPQLSLLPTSTIIECGCLTSNGQWLVCVSTCRLLPGTLTAERRPFGDVFPLPLWQAIAASVCSAHLGSQDEADIPYSLRTNRGRHDVRKKKNLWCLRPLRFWGCLFPTMIAHILTATHFCLRGPIRSNLHRLLWAVPSPLFSLSPFCSAIFATLECISFIPT